MTRIPAPYDGYSPERANSNMQPPQTAHSIFAFVLVVLTGLIAQTASAADRIGQVSRIQASAEVLSAGQTRPLALLAPIHMNDVVSTGPGARLEITLIDGTRLTLGQLARVTMDDFVYQMQETPRGRLDVSVKGAFRFVTGGISKIAGSQVTARTPFAIIGVRGTDFWAGPVDGISGVVLFEGVVSVTSANVEVVLDTPGQGTNISVPGGPPGNVTIWSRDKTDRALNQVAFQ